MKKTLLKKGIALLLVVFLCLSLCSCDELDAMREEHAVWAEGGILYKDHLYQPVGNNGNYLNYNYTNHRFVNVTASDVPVLLSSLFNAIHYSNENETILTGFETWYIREDLVEGYYDSIKNGIHYTHLGFDYFDKDLGEHTDYLLTEYERHQLMSCRTVTADVALEAEAGLSLFEQSNNGLFRRGGKYSVVRMKENYYVVEYIDGVDQPYLYPATAEAEEIIKSFFQKATGNHSHPYQDN